MKDVPANIVADFEDLKAPGDLLWRGSKPGEKPTRAVFLCPCGCEALLGFVVAGDSTQHPVWQWNGNEQKPTVTPSIRFLSGCQWHGFLTDGVFKTC